MYINDIIDIVDNECGSVGVVYDIIGYGDFVCININLPINE